jgi:DNA-binding MarR family transcriptional regulator
MRQRSRSSAPSRRELAGRLHSAAIHLLRRVRRVDVETGLTPSRASALSVLVFGGPRPLGELARAEQVSAPTMTRLVSGLERDGLVRRQGSADDRRRVLVHATPEGVRRLQRGRERRVEELTALLQGLGEAQLRALRAAAELLERLLGRDAGHD